MFQSIAVVALPALVVLTAGFFLLRHVSKTEESGRKGASSAMPGMNNAQQTRARTDRDNSRARRRKLQETLDRECVVCFEHRSLVELYPCEHKNLCEPCVTRLISMDKRACPLCRKRIQGFV